MIIKINENDVSIEYGDGVIDGSISSNCLGFFFFEKHKKNDILFELAGIDDALEFQKQILGYNYNKGGKFPYCKKKDDTIKLLKALVSVYNKMHNYSKLHKHIKLNFKL